jgi:CHAD domain-containing protein
MLEYYYIHFDVNKYTDNCTQNIKRVYTKLDKYLENPTEDNIHHMRTSLRRLEATYQSSPKQIRKKKKFKEFASVGKRLFRINSNIRDIDIILEKLAKEGKMHEQQLEHYENPLVQEKENQLEEARTIALDLKRIVVPSLYDKNKTDKNFEGNSMKRLAKISRKLKNKIEKRIPIVIGDDSKITELHELRKDSKKLRYLIELVINKEENDTSKRNINDDMDVLIDNNYQKILEHLEKIQGMLGDIHDYDIALDYLRQHQASNNPLITSTITNIMKVRKAKFDDFVNYGKSTRTLVVNGGL